MGRCKLQVSVGQLAVGVAIRRILRSALGLLWLILLTAPISANNDRPQRHYEFWAGVDVTEGSWLGYTGGTYAPFGDIHEEGWKLRAVTGYGRYKVWNAYFEKYEQDKAETWFVDALVGYMWRLDPLIAKLLVGVSSIEHTLPDNVRRLALLNVNFGRVDGQEFGAKLQAEFWLNIGDNAFASWDLAWAQAHNTRSVRARLGYMVLSNVSVGIEAGLNADDQSFCYDPSGAGSCVELDEMAAFNNALTNNGRVDVFGRYSWDGGELSGAVGALGDDKRMYGKLNYLMQF